MIAVAAGLTFAVPASAQVPKCDYYRNCQGSTPPSNGGYDNRYDNGGYYGGGYYNQPTLVDALVLSLFRPSHKHRAGDMCYTPSGQVLGLDDRKKWYVVPGVESFGEKGSITQVRCDQFMSQK
jgi:hypothetical protein